MPEWRSDEPPKAQHQDIMLLVEVEVRAYWDEELQTFVLSRPLHIESIQTPKKWRAE